MSVEKTVDAIASATSQESHCKGCGSRLEWGAPRCGVCGKFTKHNRAHEKDGRRGRHAKAEREAELPALVDELLRSRGADRATCGAAALSVATGIVEARLMRLSAYRYIDVRAGVVSHSAKAATTTWATMYDRELRGVALLETLLPRVLPAVETRPIEVTYRVVDTDGSVIEERRMGPGAPAQRETVITRQLVKADDVEAEIVEQAAALARPVALLPAALSDPAPKKPAKPKPEPTRLERVLRGEW